MSKIIAVNMMPVMIIAIKMTKTGTPMVRLELGLDFEFVKLVSNKADTRNATLIPKPASNIIE